MKSDYVADSARFEDVASEWLRFREERLLQACVPEIAGL